MFAGLFTVTSILVIGVNLIIDAVTITHGDLLASLTFVTIFIATGKAIQFIVGTRFKGVIQNLLGYFNLRWFLDWLALLSFSTLALFFLGQSYVQTGAKFAQLDFQPAAWIKLGLAIENLPRTVSTFQYNSLIALLYLWSLKSVLELVLKHGPLVKRIALDLFYESAVRLVVVLAMFDLYRTWLQGDEAAQAKLTQIEREARNRYKGID
jgi:hypothetical protein